MSSKKTIYDFFTLTEKHLDAGKIKAKYKCLICDKEIQINSGVNSNLHEHISKIHNDEYTEFKVINREDKLKANLPITPNKRNHDSAFGSPTPKLAGFFSPLGKRISKCEQTTA